MNRIAFRILSAFVLIAAIPACGDTEEEEAGEVTLELIGDYTDGFDNAFVVTADTVTLGTVDKRQHDERVAVAIEHAQPRALFAGYVYREIGAHVSCVVDDLEVPGHDGFGRDDRNGVQLERLLRLELHAVTPRVSRSNWSTAATSSINSMGSSSLTP